MERSNQRSRIGEDRDKAGRADEASEAKCRGEIAGTLRYLNEKGGMNLLRNRRVSIGRGDKIRTCDPLHPMQVRYQAAPRPDRGTE